MFILTEDNEILNLTQVVKVFVEAKCLKAEISQGMGKITPIIAKFDHDDEAEQAMQRLYREIQREKMVTLNIRAITKRTDS